jgi:large subunit ribosomal protein L24
MRKIRKGDNVVVLSGRDKGRRGAVLEVRGEGLLLVEGINVLKKHQRGNPQANTPGGIVDKAMPIRACKVAIWNPSGKKSDRIGVKKLGDGRKVRFFKSNGEMIDA